LSTHVVTAFRARPEFADTLITLLSGNLRESLAHAGCEAIHLRRDQDDPAHIVSFTQWATRQDYVDYLAWRTETGVTGDVAELLMEPMSIEYFDDLVSVTR
jgi:quinol monooxygenase YgiN